MEAVIAIFEAVKKLAEFQVIQVINTGDRARDNLLHGICLAIVAWFYKGIPWAKFLSIITGISLIKKKFHKITKVEELITELEKPEYTWKYISWPSYQEEILSRKLIKFYVEKRSGTLELPQTLRETNIACANPNMTTTTFKKSVAQNKHDPVYVNEDGVVCYFYKSEGDVLTISYTSQETLDAFLSELNKVEVPIKAPNIDPQLIKILDHDGREAGFIYPDRTFDQFVSRYKPRIMNIIENFKNANKDSTSMGGFGTYNLGILLHGKPGTGKTFFIKALANAMQRQVKILDVRKMKTIQDFSFALKDATKYIFVLEEFDCVQGIIKDRSANTDNESKEATIHNNSAMKALQDRKLQILELMAKASSGRQVSKGEGGKEQRETHEEKPNAALSAELSSIDKEIKELKDSISLDSILTILDGPIEVRGRIIVATTNFPDKIDRALLRKGRIDMQLNLDTFNKEEMVELLTMIYQEAPPKKVANKFVLDKWTPVMIINKATTVPKEQCYEELSADPVEGIDF